MHNLLESKAIVSVPTGRLHGIVDRAVWLLGSVGTETIALDDFQFAMAIHTCTGQYVSFDTISFIIMFY